MVSKNFYHSLMNGDAKVAILLQTHKFSAIFFCRRSRNTARRFRSKCSFIVPVIDHFRVAIISFSLSLRFHTKHGCAAFTAAAFTAALQSAIPIHSGIESAPESREVAQLSTEYCATFHRTLRNFHRIVVVSLLYGLTRTSIPSRGSRPSRGCARSGQIGAFLRPRR